MVKELVFSVTAADCDWSYTKGTGAGGQARNKTSSAVHCTHRESGAHGYAEDHREQSKNRQLAFERMANTEVFRKWSTMEFQRKTGIQAVIEEKVNKEMKNIRVDIKDENGRWIDENEVKKDEEKL